MENINLSPRLLTVAEFVRKGSRVADIGTDHAYLPVFLAKNGLIESAVAADVRNGPLDNARLTIDEYKAFDKVSTRLSDGLDEFSSDEVDDIVFAGMGGELIVKLMEKCPWVKEKDKHFIFQPMTHSELLRAYLVENAFEIQEEKAVYDSSRPYVVFDAVYTGIKKDYPPIFRYIGKLDTSGVAAKEIIYHNVRYIRNKLKAGEDEILSACLSEMEKLL